MRTDRLLVTLAATAAIGLGLWACSNAHETALVSSSAAAQAPTWSAADEHYFLHGSMDTEFVPELVLQAFEKTYPALFPTPTLTHLGLIPDPAFGWPVGFSRNTPRHLAGMPSVGINCASCHVGELSSAQQGGAKVRVLGGASAFNVDAFFGAVFACTFQTQDPANMKRFLLACMEVSSPTPPLDAHSYQVYQENYKRRFDAAWDRQSAQVIAAIAADPSGAMGAGPGGLQELSAADLNLSVENIGTADLAKVSVAMLKLFHNMRAALHVPDLLPKELPPQPGPGRNDAFGLLSAGLFGVPQPFAPVKFGLVWNVQHRKWVHWDGNTRSPLGRNLLAAAGLGAPLIGKEVMLELAKVQRQTDLSEKILAPHYPWGVDRPRAAAGAKLYAANCAACHTGVENDQRLYTVASVQTDPLRAQLLTPAQADRLNAFLAEVKIAGYTPAAQLGIRSTGKYFSPSLEGVWARSPYLHNGSVRTMAELLSPPAERPRQFHRGSTRFDEQQMGLTDEGAYLLDTTVPGNRNTGHEYGTKLSAEEKRELIEYLKSL